MHPDGTVIGQQRLGAVKGVGEPVQRAGVAGRVEVPAALAVRHEPDPVDAVTVLVS
jgi:hypothetical protein